MLTIEEKKKDVLLEEKQNGRFHIGVRPNLTSSEIRKYHLTNYRRGFTRLLQARTSTERYFI